MRKVISILLASAMVLSLYACGGSQSAPPAGDSNKTQEQADNAEEKQEAAEPAAESAEPAAEAEAPAAEAEGTAADTAQTPDNAGEKKDYTDTYKKFGMTVHYPEEFASTTGVLYPREGSEFEPGINALAYYYAAMPMVNIWATWCGNCVGELAGLAEMNHRLADKNVAVIGICNDADTEPDKCKALIEENGVDYLNLMPVDDLDKMLEIPGLPTSYFVDSEGKILCAPFIGAPMEMVAYEKVIDSLLADEEVVVERGMPVTPNSEGVYRVIVTDSDGDFVPGVRVQFCSDSFCMMGKTDENGVAVFKADEGTVYTAHIMKFPDGYVPNADEYKTTDTYCDICIVLQKQ